MSSGSDSPKGSHRDREGRPISRESSEERGSALHRKLVATGGDAGRHAGLGLQFALTIGLFAAIGYWLDGRLGSAPWLLLVGIFLGATAGFVYLVKTIGGGSGGRKERRDSRS